MAQVFLDLDGTLIDPKPGITACVIHALQALRLPAPDPDALTWAIGPPLIDSFARLGAPDPQAALALYRERFAVTGLFEARVYEGIPDALGALKTAGHSLHLATAKPHVFARRITAHFGLAGFLDAEFGPELDGTRSDKAELLDFAMDRLGTGPRDAVMIGDRGVDITAARTAGLRSVGVTWGYGAGDELQAADALCDRPENLPDCVAGLMAQTLDRNSRL